jgi:MFS family permease
VTESSGKQPSPRPGEAVPYPPASRGWYVIFVLYLAYTLAFVDRQIMAFLVGPIRQDLAISDFEFSLIQGLAFAIFYGMLGVPIGRLADARNRRNIIAIGIGLWSLMTGLCGLAGKPWQLFAARLGVGVGEAALSPSAISMISDYFPKEKRGLPINVYSAGVQTGAGLANIFGGLIVAYASAGGAAGVAFLGDLKPWQTAFVLVALPGLLVMLLTFTIREPARHEKLWTVAGPKFSETIKYVRSHWIVYVTLMVGAGFGAMASYGTFSWAPEMFSRVYHWDKAQIGLHIGTITMIFGVAGLVASGAAAGALAKRGHTAVFSKLMVASMVCAAPPAMLLIAVSDPYWTLGCLTLLVFFLSTPVGLVQAALTAVTPSEMRGQIIAVYLIMVTILGVGCGPSAVAAVTDFVFVDDDAVGKSIAIVATVAVVLCAGLLAASIPAYKRKMAQAEF